MTSQFEGIARGVGHYGPVGTSNATPLPPPVAHAVPATFDELYESTVDFVWRSARRLGVRDDALDDVTQKVFLVAYRQLPAFEARASVKTWLFAILYRTVREHRRLLRRKSPHERDGAPLDPDELVDARADTDALMTRAEASRVIDVLLDSLDQDKRVVFVLSELEEMTANEIAEIVGVPPKTVYSRLYAARADFEKAAARFRQRQGRRSP